MDIELWKQRKKELKLTFEDISQTTGVSIRTLKGLFSGERTNTTTYTAQAIENALGIGKDIEVDISAEEQAFIETFRQLTEDEKKEFYSIANFILAKRK